MIEPEYVFGIMAVACGLIKFYPYITRLLAGQVKPHALSWATWGAMSAVVFALSILNGGGGGAWVWLASAVVCLGICGWALVHGDRNITRADLASFGTSIITIVTYVFTKNAALAVILAALIDTLGFIPTYRKSYADPHGEPVVTYTLSFMSSVFSLAALQTYSFVTTFFQAIHIIDNVAFVVFLVVRREMLARRASPPRAVAAA